MSFSLNFTVIILFLTICHIFTLVKADDEGNFTFLVTGGYRPLRHTFSKHIVSIRTRYFRKFFGDNHICGGSILGPRLILTAAHCVWDFARGGKQRTVEFRVVAKTPNRLKETSASQVIDVKKIIMHPGFDLNEGTKNDIALMHLEDAIELDGILAKEIRITNVAPEVDTVCTVVGWGRVFQSGPVPASPMYVDLKIYAKAICESEEEFYSEAEMICAGDRGDPSKDSCQGDSGGPFICNGTVAGIVSFGFGCAKGRPGFYTNVWNYRNWIKENNGCSNCPNFCILLAMFIFYIAIFKII